MHVVFTLCFVAGTFAAATAQAGPAKTGSSEQQAIRKASDAYCAAFSAGDAEALANFWTEDAEYLNGDGRTVRGKQNIEEYFALEFDAAGPRRLATHIGALRFLKADLAVEDGTSALTWPDGHTSLGRYNAIWAYTDGHWLLARVQDLPGETPAPVGVHHEHLQSLERLVGEWTETDPATHTVDTFGGRWVMDKNFLMVRQAMSVDGHETMSVARLIGWDPQQNKLRSWFFDSHGGYGEGLLEQTTNGWTIQTQGVLPNGKPGSTTHKIEFVDPDHFVWRSQGARIGELPVADRQVEFTRAGN